MEMLMEFNGTMMQYFEWDLPNDGKHWQRLRDDAQHLSEKGITAVWIPPCFKGTGQEDVGYGVYDLYDLGEFDQKETVRTKYGTKEELHEAIDALHEYGIQVYADVVLNHKAAADETESFQAIQVDENDRHKAISEEHEIEGWTHFQFLGREGKYSDFEWHWYHFSGVSRDEKSDTEGIFQIMGEGKGWADDNEVSNEFGNYDYLMFADIDYGHGEVLEETKQWLKWFINETEVDGIRLDAVKHIKSSVINEFVDYVREEFSQDFFFVAEYWEQDTEILEQYLEKQDFDFSMMDVGFHYALHEASVAPKNFDLAKLFDGTLYRNDARYAVTFVDNHDSQPGQSLESFVKPWFKPLAYGIILLSSYGYPCLYYPDYYGYQTKDVDYNGNQELIDKLLYVRQQFAYGETARYLDDASCIGFTRSGDDDPPVGCAVVISTTEENQKEMNVGSLHAGETYIDVIGYRKEEITIDENGSAVFAVDATSISVWVPKEKLEE